MCCRLSFQAGEWCEPITLRPPNEATSSTPVQYWQHHPEKLIFQSCDYEAYVSPNTLLNYTVSGWNITSYLKGHMHVTMATERHLLSKLRANKCILTKAI